MVPVQMGIPAFRPGILVQDPLEFLSLGPAAGFLQPAHLLPQVQDIRTGVFHEFPDRFLPEIIESLFHITQTQFPGKLHRPSVGKIRVQQTPEQSCLAAAVDPHQAHFLPLPESKTHILKNIVDAETFFQAVHGQQNIHTAYFSYPLGCPSCHRQAVSTISSIWL